MRGYSRTMTAKVHKDRVVVYPDKEHEIGYIPKPKKDHSGWVECEACGTYNHFLNSVQVDLGDNIGDKTLWFCNKNCYTAYEL